MMNQPMLLESNHILVTLNLVARSWRLTMRGTDVTFSGTSSLYRSIGRFENLVDRIYSVEDERNCKLVDCEYRNGSLVKL